LRDPARELLRHTIATVAYRGAKATRNAPAEFADFRAADDVRTPIQIVAHMADLYDWALSLAKGKWDYNQSAPQSWERELERFYASLGALDEYLASDAPLEHSAEKLFQGPIADSLTHVGQIAFLRRLADSPIRAESYARSDIVAGRVGREQTPSQFEFD
jgi:hypothetical protein